MIISIDTVKTFDRLQTVLDKNSQKSRNREELPQFDKELLLINL